MRDRDKQTQSSVVLDASSVQHLLMDLKDGLAGKVARLSVLASAYEWDVKGPYVGVPGGDVAQEIWREARWSFVHGNYIATVILCQVFAEHLVAATIYGEGEALPNRVKFGAVLKRSVKRGCISEHDAEEIARLMHMRNALSHFRKPFEEGHAMSRVASEKRPLRRLVKDDAVFAIKLGGATSRKVIDASVTREMRFILSDRAVGHSNHRPRPGSTYGSMMRSQRAPSRCRQPKRARVHGARVSRASAG